LKLPLLVVDARSVSTEVKFWPWGVAVELDDEFDDDLSTCCVTAWDCRHKRYVGGPVSLR
jgi:hypothetical protein